MKIFKSKEYASGPLLSVIIPSYNHAKFIKEAVDSVLRQTYSNLELIIVDDGSSDNTLEVLDQYKDNRLQIFTQKNHGAHCAINRGLEISQGDYLAILNSDDIFENRRFETMIGEMQKSHAGFACSYIQVIDSKGKKLGIKKGWQNMPSWELPHPELSFSGKDKFKENLLITNFTSTTSNFIFTRYVYKKIGGMRNLRFAHDWDFALRAAEVTECQIIEQPLLRYRVHDNNTITSNRKWMLFEIIWVWAANLERFYQSIIFNTEDDNTNVIRLTESLNLQGNDKLFWILKSFIEAKKQQGIEHPEELLLDDEKLRTSLLEYIQE